MKNNKALLYTTIFLILLAVAFTKWPAFQKPSEQEQIAVGLKLGRLAELPMSATDTKVDSTTNLFSKTVYISFKGTKEEIESFIHNSDSLKNLQPKTIDHSNKNGAVYYSFSDGKVAWFNIETKKARVFEIQQDKDANYGTVIVDDVTDTVYIRTSHS